MRIFPSLSMVWVKNDPETLLAFEDNVDRCWSPRKVDSCVVDTAYIHNRLFRAGYH